jgi:putative polyhydroxyalkanoate system protein
VNKTISVSIPHRLTQEQARERLKSGIADLRTKYAAQVSNLQETWTGDRMDFKLSAVGQSLSGRIHVLADAVKLELDLPWLLAAFAEKLRPHVEREGRKMLEQK